MKSFNKHHLIAASALFILVVAVQVSTGETASLLLIGLDILELTNNSGLSLPTFFDVTLSLNEQLYQLVPSVINCIVEQLIN